MDLSCYLISLWAYKPCSLSSWSSLSLEDHVYTNLGQLHFLTGQELSFSLLVHRLGRGLVTSWNRLNWTQCRFWIWSINGKNQEKSEEPDSCYWLTLLMTDTPLQLSSEARQGCVPSSSVYVHQQRWIKNNIVHYMCELCLALKNWST